MRLRYVGPILVLLLVIHVPQVRAEEECMPVPGIAGEVEKFLSEAAVAHAANHGSMPLRDVLFGVTDLDADDASQLNAREPVNLTRRTADGGDYNNHGPKKLMIEGMFAGRETLFRLPKRIKGRYRLADKGVTLTYDPAHAVEVGEHIIGIPMFVSVHRMIVTRTQLSFYFSGNDSGEPDRCYLITKKA